MICYYILLVSPSSRIPDSILKAGVNSTSLLIHILYSFCFTSGWISLWSKLLKIPKSGCPCCDATPQGVVTLGTHTNYTSIGKFWLEKNLKRDFQELILFTIHYCYFGVSYHQRVSIPPLL